MDPYPSPIQEPPPQKEEVNVHRGSPCLHCGSLDTSRESILRPSPNLLAAMYLGWIYILWRTAFRVNKEICYDCGAYRRYRTTGARIAMGLLFLTAGLIVLSYLSVISPRPSRRVSPSSLPARHY